MLNKNTPSPHEKPIRAYLLKKADKFIFLPIIFYELINDIAPEILGQTILTFDFISPDYRNYLLIVTYLFTKIALVLFKKKGS